MRAVLNCAVRGRSWGSRRNGALGTGRGSAVPLDEGPAAADLEEVGSCMKPPREGSVTDPGVERGNTLRCYKQCMTLPGKTSLLRTELLSLEKQTNKMELN